MSAPINPWRTLRDAQQGEELADFEEVLAQYVDGKGGLEELQQRRASQAEEELEVAHRYNPPFFCPPEWEEAADAAAAEEEEDEEAEMEDEEWQEDEE